MNYVGAYLEGLDGGVLMVPSDNAVHVCGMVIIGILNIGIDSIYCI